VRFLFYGQFTAVYAERMPVTTPQLSTERLLLQPLVSADAEQIQRVFPRWEIVRYLIGTIPGLIRTMALPSMLIMSLCQRQKRERAGTGRFGVKPSQCNLLALYV
jgi:hypothetical protein